MTGQQALSLPQPWNPVVLDALAEEQLLCFSSTLLGLIPSIQEGPLSTWGPAANRWWDCHFPLSELSINPENLIV